MIQYLYIFDILKLSSQQGAQLNSIELLFLFFLIFMYVFIYLLDVHWILRMQSFVLVNNLVEKGLF